MVHCDEEFWRKRREEIKKNEPLDHYLNETSEMIRQRKKEGLVYIAPHILGSKTNREKCFYDQTNLVLGDVRGLGDKIKGYYRCPSCRNEYWMPVDEKTRNQMKEQSKNGRRTRIQVAV
jgi:hypothetical protein